MKSSGHIRWKANVRYRRSVWRGWDLGSGLEESDTVGSVAPLEVKHPPQTAAPKRYYLSTRKDRSAAAANLTEALHAAGWERTYTWSDLGSAGVEAFAAAASTELEAVRAADVLIVLLPGGFGTHVEIGAALALGKPVVLHAPDRGTLETPYPCIFHYHPGVTLMVSEAMQVPDLVAAMERVRNAWRSARAF